MSATRKLFDSFIGREVRVNGVNVRIDSVVHSFAHPTRALINEEHFIEYLDLFAQMNGEKLNDVEKAKWRKIVKQNAAQRKV